MFEEPRFIQNSLSIVFPREMQIRRRANDFEDLLKGTYAQPQTIPVPDELDPEVPRLIFGSVHGYSQIVITQINVSLNVTYSSEWQADIQMGRGYLLERIPLLFSLLSILSNPAPLFVGLTTSVHIKAQVHEKGLLDFLLDKFSWPRGKTLMDFRLRWSKVVAGKYYSNITVENYRRWAEEDGMIRPLSRKKTSEIGIKIVGDFNDRHSFNELEEYHSSVEQTRIIVEQGIQQVTKELDNLAVRPS
ncbi:MAG: hypothetical protein NTU59_09620 [Coprothermobacterota bacterium]|nr:hypothetical protein [Coprothermobacterota bacterium]